MSAIRTLFANGGPVFVAIMVLSVFLYGRAAYLLLDLRRRRRQVDRLVAEGGLGEAAVARLQEQFREVFRQQRIAIGAMIAAGPLLGLLGTVRGMIASFESLSTQGASRSIAGMAGGISEVLTDTESGLAVAIPAVLLLYVAHRQMEKGVEACTKLRGAPAGTD